MLAPSEFDAARTGGYLDTATYGLPPASALAALDAAATAWRDRGSWLAWEEDGEACRSLFARLLDTSTSTVALVPAVSVSAGLIAASLRAERGDNVVVHAADFASAIFPFAGLESRGVELRAVSLDQLASSVDRRTALVATSLVQSADGAVADLDALRATGARVFLDVSQALGALDLDVADVDYVAGHAYKWLLCARGLGFLHVRPDRLGEIEPWTAGWKSRAKAYANYYGLPRDLTDDARRLDVSLAWLVAAAARRSLELIVAIGPKRIAAHDLGLARGFAEQLGLPLPSSPIVRLEVESAAGLADSLGEAGISCSVRAGSVRLSFHLYNDEADVERVVDVLRRAGLRA